MTAYINTVVYLQGNDQVPTSDVDWIKQAKNV
jgi:hypothetical protein